MYTFEEIRGNTPLVEQLRRSAASGRSSHAYLFLGGAGAGKRLIANTFAKALQCEGEKRPCDSCKSCHAFNHGNHPDVIYFQPLKNGKTYTIEDVREQLLETVDLKPFQYEKKIYIIEKADTLNIQSQNALLKTLEEPPAHAVFLLLAERAEAFLPTILSRVVVMKIVRFRRKRLQITSCRQVIWQRKAISFRHMPKGESGRRWSLSRMKAFGKCGRIFWAN